MPHRAWPSWPGQEHSRLNPFERAPFGEPPVQLGVEVHPLTDQLADYFGAPADQGTLIARVLEATPAARAGLRAGDVILRVNGRSVRNALDVRGALQEADRNLVTVDILRNREPMTIEVPLQEDSPPAEEDEMI